MIRKTGSLALLLAILWLATAAPALAGGTPPAGEAPVGEQFPPWATALAWLVPIGLGMLACGAVPPDRVAAVIRTGWLALGVSVIGYWLAGFAFQFGGAGFVYDHPDLVGLAREWTWAPLDAAWGSQWGAIGLEGYMLRGLASTPAALRLFLTQLPWLVTAVAVPLWSLQGRVGPVVLFLSGLLQATLYALLGNWIWGGGWLANLGLNLGLGHGYVDDVGAGPVHLAGAVTALAGMLAFGVRRYVVRPVVGKQLALPGLPEREPYVPMPALHLPVLATFGAWLAAIGWLGWASSTPLHALAESPLPWMAAWINLWLAAAGGAVVALCFSWLTTGEGNALMVARGVVGALVAAGPGLPFYPPWAALVVGAGAGLIVPFVQYTIEHLLRFDDPTSAVATHGVPALWGLLAVGLFAGGQAGAGWNRVGLSAYLDVQGQGVSGYWVAVGYASDWPGQFQAQLVGALAIGTAAFVLSWLLFAGVQGLRRAWGSEYTLRLPRRRRRAAQRTTVASWARSLRWPRIRVVRQEPRAAETAAPGGASAWRRRLAAVWTPLWRWIERAAIAATAGARAAARRLVRPRAGAKPAETSAVEPTRLEEAGPPAGPGPAGAGDGHAAPNRVDEAKDAEAGSEGAG